MQHGPAEQWKQPAREGRPQVAIDTYIQVNPGATRSMAIDAVSNFTLTLQLYGTMPNEAPRHDIESDRRPTT